MAVYIHRCCVYLSYICVHFITAIEVYHFVVSFSTVLVLGLVLTNLIVLTLKFCLLFAQQIATIQQALQNKVF